MRKLTQEELDRIKTESLRVYCNGVCHSIKDAHALKINGYSLAELIDAAEFQGETSYTLQTIVTLAHKYGIALSDESDLVSSRKEFCEAIEKRIMPPGMTWPRFEDGEPVLVGDEFETMASGTKKVDAIKFEDGYIFSLEFNNGWDTAEFYKNARVKRPEHRETLQDVIDDYDKSTTEYWKCSSIPCHMCPSKIDGKTPHDYYGIVGCDIAKIHDIKRRLEAIQERMGGEE